MLTLSLKGEGVWALILSQGEGELEADMADLNPEQWSHYTTRINGINIHYVVEGDGDPVLFLHGWPEFWYSWRNQINVFSGQYQVIVPDMRGFGHSDKPFIRVRHADGGFGYV